MRPDLHKYLGLGHTVSKLGGECSGCAGSYRCLCIWMLVVAGGKWHSPGPLFLEMYPERCLLLQHML